MPRIMYNRDYTPERISELKPNEIFVFGSNLAGAHGGGAAQLAYKRFGAPLVSLSSETSRKNKTEGKKRVRR